MPGKIKVKVLAGRNLPVMDRAGDTTDAFVEIKFGSVTHKTDVCRKSLNPQWNSTEWYRFEVDESELQDEPLQLRLMDHDTYSANDAIGKVVISLAPLLAREAAKSEKSAGPHNGAVMSGWIPVFDTMHGIRGELNVIVKVELFSDFNKYKTSSIGVQFFHCPMIPPGYKASAIHGFVEELVVNDDPEYQWIDKIRTPRASNEARQVAFIKLSNQVQRLVGLKAAELGANAVVGYQQDFDLEGEAGVVARAIGTAVSIEPLPTPSLPQTVPPCSQQQLKKYLDILATGDETVTDLNQYFQNHQDELGRLLNILHPKLSSNFLDETENNEEDDKSMGLTRQSSIKSYTDSVSIYQDDFVTQSLRTISEDQTELNRLLNRKDDEDSDSSGPFSKIKKIKQNFFSKRLPSIRSKRGDKKQDINEDTLSIKSNSSDTSRLSINDIKYEFKKLKRLKTAKFQKQYKNDDDEGVGMASILARSVIHARTSLACIAESIDSETSPNATIRRSSESEPAINVTDDVKEKIQLETIIDEEDTKVSDRRYASLKNVNTESEAPPARQRKISGSCPNSPVAARSDNHLKLPGETSYFGSVSSAMSGGSSEMYSSSDADDESSDMKTDTEKSYETTASVVQTVLRQSTSPSLIAQIDKKLSVLDCVTPEPKDNEDDTDSSKSEEEKIPEVDNNKNEQLEERSNKSRDPSSSEQSERSSPRHSRHESYGGREPAPTKNESFNASSTPVGMHRRSSDSDLSITPKGSILNSSLGNPGGAILRPSMNTNNLEMLEYPFLTMTEFPPGFIVHIGGMVCARSVKLVGAGGEESARAAAWAELRTEMRAHARALRCAAVLAYREAAAICEEVCVLSASGTAAVINLDCDYTADPDGYVNCHSLTKSTIEEDEACCTAHVPYSPDTGPYKAELQHCASCRRARVPAVLLATCAKPSKLATYGKTVPLTACAARARRGLAAEAGARELSDQLPFLEYELHKLLLAKLRMQGANALFNLHTQISVGERCVVALACGAACRLAALPDSHPPTVKASENDKDAVELQRALWDTFTANKIANGYDVGPPETAPPASPARPAPPELDLGADKDTCVLELDETEDVETARLLATRRANIELFTNGLRAAPAAPPQAFAQVWRARFTPSGAGGAERHVSRALLGAQYKLRRLRPVALALAPCALQLATPDDEIQLVISGTAIPLETRGAGDTEEGIFALDEENELNANNVQAVSRVILTSLSQVAGSRCSRRVCALRSLFVRETTAVRELGGLSGFLHTFTSEVLAIVRAYTAALGGNALTSFYITQLMLQDNAHKNQGQCLMSVGGDVVHITY